MREGKPEEPIRESEEARCARREAEEEARRLKEKMGWAFALPRWYRIPRVLPERDELLGSLHAEYRTCKDVACPCQSGAEVHGPYWYRRWRDEEGRQRKEYVKRSDVERIREAIARRRWRLRLEREKRKEHMRLGKYARKRNQADTSGSRQDAPEKRG